MKTHPITINRGTIPKFMTKQEIMLKLDRINGKITQLILSYDTSSLMTTREKAMLEVLIELNNATRAIAEESLVGLEDVWS